MAPVIEKITEPLALGEGPHWDEKKQKLYFVDIPNSEIHCYDPKTKKHTRAVVADGQKTVSFIIPVKNEVDKFVISYGCDIAAVTWDGISDKVSDLNILVTLDENSKGMRINDAKCSPTGVLFAGTMESNLNLSSKGTPGKGSLYAITGKRAKKLLSDLSISNGLAWTRDEKKCFYIDSLKYSVDVYDYDVKKKELSNKKILFDFKKENIPGFPDGQTIDSDGNLWVAVFRGNQVLKIDSNSGKLLDFLKFPAARVTSVVFGGKNLDELYVTTSTVAGEGHFVLPAIEDSQGGCCFRVTGLGVKGLPSPVIKL